VIAEVICWVLLVLGAVFCVIGGIGLLRLPDVYTRMHGAGITDTMGAGLVLTGLMVYEGLTLVTVKLVLIMGFLLLTSPTATHAVAKAARMAGIKPLMDEKE